MLGLDADIEGEGGATFGGGADGFAISGSGTFYAFAYESDSWVCSCLFTI